MDQSKCPRYHDRRNQMSWTYESGPDAIFLFQLPNERTWDCSTCTFQNAAGTFKCSICHVLKRLSKRKSSINPDLLNAQIAKALKSPPKIFSVAKSNISVPYPVPSSSKTDEFDIAIDELVTYFYSKV